MPTALVRVYEELNDFIPASEHKRRFPAVFQEGDTVKALLEAIGIPHTEIDLILINGLSVPFSYQLQDQDRVSAYPLFESFDITSLSKVRPKPLRKTKFILDVHLGRLAKELRMLGFDTVYSNQHDDEMLSAISNREERIILTRDRGLLKRKIISHGYCVRSKKPQKQITEVIQRFDLTGTVKPFSRCLLCNEPLRPAVLKKIRNRLPKQVVRSHKRFYECHLCGRIYWQGSHWEHMKRSLTL